MKLSVVQMLTGRDVTFVLWHQLFGEEKSFGSGNEYSRMPDDRVGAAAHQNDVRLRQRLAIAVECAFSRPRRPDGTTVRLGDSYSKSRKVRSLSRNRWFFSQSTLIRSASSTVSTDARIRATMIS